MTLQLPAHGRSFFHKVHKTVCIVSLRDMGFAWCWRFWFLNTRFCKVSGHPTRWNGLSNTRGYDKKKIKFDFVSEALPCDFLSYYQHTFLVSNYSDSGSHLIFPLLAISSSNHKLIHCLITRTKHSLRLFGALGEFHIVKKEIVPEVIELVKNQGV